MKGRAPSDLFGKDGILSALTKALDEERAVPSDDGASQKTVITDSGKVVLDIPQDRNGPFDPLLIGKYQRRPSCPTGRATVWACGFRPTKGRSSGPRC